MHRTIFEAVARGIVAPPHPGQVTYANRIVMHRTIFEAVARGICGPPAHPGQVTYENIDINYASCNFRNLTTQPDSCQAIQPSNHQARTWPRRVLES